MKPLALLLTSLVFCGFGAECGQAQVYSNARHRASANPNARRSIGTGALTISRNRGGYGRYSSGLRVGVPGISYSSSGRSRSISTYGISSYGGSAISVRSYSSWPGTRRYSSLGYSTIGVPGFTGVPPIIYPHAYVFYNAPRFDPWGTCYGIYPTIVAPPITVPYAGFASTIALNTLPLNSVAGQISQQNAPAATLQPLPQQAPAGNAAPVPAGAPVLARNVDDRPIVNEFPAAPLDPKLSNAADRIRSLRYQTTGDTAFLNSDYPTAEVFFRTAAETAPERRASWVRLAWSQVAQKRYDEAVVNLKKGLSGTGDSTMAWVSGEELYGRRLHSDAVMENEELLQWVELRPNSTDRLLLAAAFEKLTGRTSIARELLDHAERGGLDMTLVEALQKLTQPRRAAPAADNPVEATPEPVLPGASADHGDPGIRIHGDDDVTSRAAVPLPIEP